MVLKNKQIKTNDFPKSFSHIQAFTTINIIFTDSGHKSMDGNTLQTVKH